MNLSLRALRLLMASLLAVVLIVWRFMWPDNRSAELRADAAPLSAATSTPSPTRPPAYPLPPGTATPTATPTPKKSTSSSAVTSAYPLPGSPSSTTATPTPATTPYAAHPPLPYPTQPVKPQVMLVVKPNTASTPSVQVFSTISQTLVPPRISTALPYPPGANRPPATPPTTPRSPASGFVDNWTPLLNDSLDGAWPPANCGVSHANADGSDREWGQVADVRYVSPWNAAWPAAQGADRIMPPANYPPGIQTWIVCGAYDLSDAQKFFVQYDLWIDIVDPNDAFTFAYSVDNGATWTFYDDPTSPVSHDWTTYTWWLNELTGSTQVVVAFGLRSYIDAVTAEGPWLDNLRIWKYTTPSLVCGGSDNNPIGLNVGEHNSGSGALIISANDTVTLQHLQDSHVKWVRMEFQEDGGFVDLQGLDRIVDSLCAAGIRTQAIVDYATLARRDWNTNPTAYRQEFSGYAAFLADYFNGRVKYWEIWNEPDAPRSSISNVNDFANLLHDTYAAIKAVNPATQVIYGGLGSAWSGTAFSYFNNVYVALNGIVGQSQPKPFDYFADHPYHDFSDHSIDPGTYLFQDTGGSLPIGGKPPTILNKFFDQMALNGDAGKKTWVTEIGWNANSDAQPINQGCTRSTTRAQQAMFMQKSFDILLNSTLLPNGTQAIDKVMWFGYSDFSVDDVTCNGQTITQALWYGLYGQDRAAANQPAQCVFANYPRWEQCGFHFVFLPDISNGDNPLLSPSTPTP